MVPRMPAVIPPVPTRDDQFFWDGVNEGRLLLQRCGDCGVLRHPPQPMCGACGSLALDTQEASGRGTVFTWMISAPGRPEATERVVALVELEEGIRLVTNLIGVGRAEARIGMPVQVEFVEVQEGLTLPQFRPVAVA
jgi:uncharacterized OB-fold protein